MKEKDENALQRSKMQLLRYVAGYSRANQKRNSDI
jgi:hypothetical protein